MSEEPPGKPMADPKRQSTPSAQTATRGAPAKTEYIPALRYSWLTSLYDPLVALLARESTFKERLVSEAGIERDHRVLDLGCGTATLTILIKKRYPRATAVGVDGDRRVLAIARRKITRVSVDLQLDFGLASELPYPDGSFDRVLSSLLFHHLTRRQKRQAMAEVMRVLRPGGELHVADWGQARNALERAAFITVQLLDGFKTTTDNVKGRLPQMMTDAGFEEVAECGRYLTVFGVVSLLRAVKPSR